MRLELIMDSTIEPFERYGFSQREVLEKLKIVKDMGVEVSLIDVAGWTRDMLYELYMKATRIAIKRGYQGYRIRRVFGSARDSGKYFGREVPALFVYDDSGRLIDVYPHEEGGRVIGISEFLDHLISQLKASKEGGE